MVYSEKQILMLYIDLTLLRVCFALCLLDSAGGPNLKAQRLMTVVQSGVTERPRSKQQTSGVGFPPHRTPDGAAQDMVSLKRLFSDLTYSSTYIIFTIEGCTAFHYIVS